MNSILFLKAAYVIAWVVYLGYLFRMLVRTRSVERELKEVESTGAPGSPTISAEVQRQRA